MGSLPVFGTRKYGSVSFLFKEIWFHFICWILSANPLNRTLAIFRNKEICFCVFSIQGNMVSFHFLETFRKSLKWNPCQFSERWLSIDSTKTSTLKRIISAKMTRMMDTLGDTRSTAWTRSKSARSTESLMYALSTIVYIEHKFRLPTGCRRFLQRCLVT